MTRPLIPINQVGLEDIAESLLVPIPTDEANVGITSTGQYLTLQNLVCKDADGTIFEQYATLQVAKDVVRQGTSHQSFTPYNAIVYMNQHGLFLPSFALSCAIVTTLYRAAVERKPDGTYVTKNQEAKSMLDHHKNHGAGYGWHAQNTIVDYKGERIVHYPSKDDFPAAGGTVDINAVPRSKKVLPFAKTKKTLGMITSSALENKYLEQGLRNPEMKRFVHQLTGLDDPSILVEIGEYFGKPAHLWFPDDVKNCDETRAAWFGCGNTYLNLDADISLDYDNAARGVRLSAP